MGRKNCVAYIQYMRNKRHSRFGIKKFKLCDALSGYVIHVELYAGTDFPVQCEMGQAHGVVMDLLQKANLLNKGYHLSTDNFYTKPAFDQALCTTGTMLTGTVRANSRDIPVIPNTLAIGECLDYRLEDMLFVAFRE